MKPDPSLLISPRLLGHFATFQSRLGLWRLRTRFIGRRLAWRWFVEGSDAMKRGVDVLGSLAALSVLSPLLLPLAVLVRLDGGPVLFPQTRVGRFGRQFAHTRFNFAAYIDGLENLFNRVAAQAPARPVQWQGAAT